MAKKVIEDDDDLENDFDTENVDEFSEDINDEEESDDELISIDDEDIDIDIVIEIDDDDLNLETENEQTSTEEEIILSKHKIEGKHSLKYDSIFKGKKEEPLNEDDIDSFSSYFKETIEVDKSSMYHHESIDNEMYIRAKQVKERVYDVLKLNTSLNFLNNRRKPSKVDLTTIMNY